MINHGAPPYPSQTRSALLSRFTGGEWESSPSSGRRLPDHPALRWSSCGITLPNMDVVSHPPRVQPDAATEGCTTRLLHTRYRVSGIQRMQSFIVLNGIWKRELVGWHRPCWMKPGDPRVAAAMLRRSGPVPCIDGVPIKSRPSTWNWSIVSTQYRCLALALFPHEPSTFRPSLLSELFVKSVGGILGRSLPLYSPHIVIKWCTFSKLWIHYKYSPKVAAVFTFCELMQVENLSSEDQVWGNLLFMKSLLSNESVSNVDRWWNIHSLTADHIRVLLFVSFCFPTLICLCYSFPGSLTNTHQR